MSIPLPTSGQSPYHENYWIHLKNSLTNLSQDPSKDRLSDVILLHLNKAKLVKDQYTTNEVGNEIPDVKELKTLSNLLQLEENADFLPTILPGICSIALEMPNLFPSNELKIFEEKTSNDVEMNRLQVGCLVAHMFFCTILPSTHLNRKYNGHFVGNAAPTGPITFRYWLTSYKKPTILYMKSLINYFRELSTCQWEILRNEKIIYTRKVLENVPVWEKSEKRILKVVSKLSGKIGDDEGHVEMDFANENVGFGTCGTQEEIILGVSPESCPVVLFNATLGSQDAVLIQGVKRFGNFKGYGFSVQYTGLPTEQWNWRDRKILAMDAMCCVGNEKVQLEKSNVLRELNKAYCAFSMVPEMTVDTGHWGCGAFGGNPGLKSVIQIMAASEAALQEMVFFCFGDKDFHEYFSPVVTLLEKKEVTVGQLWNYTQRYQKEARQNDNVGLLKYLLKHLR